MSKLNKEKGREVVGEAVVVEVQLMESPNWGQ